MNDIQIAFVRVSTIIDASASTAPICPPIGIAYLKAIASKFSKDLEVVDSIGNYPKVRTLLDDEGAEFKLLGQKADEIASAISTDRELIFVSIMFSQDWPYAKTILSEIRKKLPDAKIVAGGEHISALPEFSMEQAPEIDLSVLGEGETTLHEILESYEKNKPLPSDLAGTYFRKSDGKIGSNIARPRIKNIGSIPWPDWNGFPLKNYFDGGHGFGVSQAGSINMPILASRGCPYRCTFCSNEFMWGTNWEARAPEDVIDEMKDYIQKYKVTNFDFYDLTAIVKREWIVRFCSLLIENKLNVTWQLPSGTRSEAIDEEVAGLLYQSGCSHLSYAPESGSMAVLEMIKKKIKLSIMLSSMAGCVKQGLSVKANIICGFPKERIKHLLESLIFISKMAWIGCADVSINQFSPYPGSELFEDLIARKKLRLDSNYFKSLSYYSSMTNAESFGDHLTTSQILWFKFFGTGLFYFISFLRRPWRIINIVRNVFKNNETTRLEKTLISFKLRFLTQKPSAT